MRSGCLCDIIMYILLLLINKSFFFFHIYILGSIWTWAPCFAFEASMNPTETLAQAALKPHQTMELEESADTTFMVM
jgi:hypothetical protein